MTEEAAERAIYAAFLVYANQKGREVFHDDEVYFRAQWPYLPGLKALVEAEIMKIEEAK
jgi:hypothetical protein